LDISVQISWLSNLCKIPSHCNKSLQFHRPNYS
jgi:hypothetical protein